GDRRGAGGPAQEGGQVAGRQQGLSQVHQMRRWRAALRRGPGEGEGGGAVRRQVGAADQLGGRQHRGGGVALQGAGGGGGAVPLDEDGAGDAAGVPPPRRADPRARVLLVPGAGAAVGGGRVRGG